jgi:hypothetical protein
VTSRTRQIIPDALRSPQPELTAPPAPPPDLTDLPSGLDVEDSAVNQSPSARLEGRTRTNLATVGVNLDAARQTMPTLGTPAWEVGVATGGTPIGQVGVLSQLAAARAANADPTKIYPTIEVVHAATLAEMYGFEPNAARQISYALADMSDEFPDIWKFFEQDFDRMTRMSEADLLAEAESGGREASEALRMMRAVDEVAGTFAGQGLVSVSQARDLVVSEGMFDQLAGRDVGFATREAWPSGLEMQAWGRGVAAGGIPNASDVTFEGGIIPTLSYTGMVGRPGSGYTVTDNNRLIITVPIIRPGSAEPEDANIVIQLDEGTTVSTPAEALIQVAYALRGKSHEVLHVDSIPGLQTAVGRMVQTVGGAARIFENSPLSALKNGLWGMLRQSFSFNSQPTVDPSTPTPPGYQPQWKTDRTIIREENEAQAELIGQAYADRNVTPLTVTTSIYTALEAEAARTGTQSPGLSAVAGEVYAMSAEDLTALESDLKDMTAEEVITHLEAQTEGETRFSEGVAKVGAVAMNVFEAWDLAVHYGGIALLSAPHALLAPILGEENDEGETVYGFDAFRAAVDEAHENTYIADLLHLDGDLGAAVNMVGSIVFDPSIWMLPGAAGNMRWFHTLMAQPEMAALAVKRLPSVRQLVRHVLTQGDPLRALFGTEMMGSDSLRAIKDMAIGAAEAGDAMRPERIAALEGVIEREIRDGWYLPHSAVRSYGTRTSIGVADLAKNFPTLGKRGQGRFLRMLENLSQKRAVTTNVAEFVDEAVDVVTQRYVGGQQRAELSEALDGMFAAYDRAAMSGGQVGSEAVVADLRAKLKGLRGQQRAAGVSRKASPMTRYWDDVQAEMDRAAKLRNELGADIDSELAAGRQVDLDMDDTLRDMDDHIAQQRAALDAARPERDTWVAAAKERAALKTQLTRNIRNLNDPVNAQPIMDWWVEFYDSWGEEVMLRKGVKPEDIWTKIPNRHHSNPSRVRLNWNRILDPTGARSHLSRIRTNSDDVSIWAPLYTNTDGTVDDTLKATLERAPFYAEIGKMPVPISPFELLSYDSAPKGAWEKMVYSRPSRAMGTTLGRIQQMFSFDVLINLITPFRVGLGDEPFRFLAETGDLGAFFRSLGASIPGTSKVEAFRKIMPSTPMLEAFIREANNPFMTRSGHFGWITRGEDGHPQAVERWLNGQLGNIEAVQVWAQAQKEGNDAIFRDWYNGVFLPRTKNKTRNVVGKEGVGRKDMEWDDWYFTANNGMDLWLDQIDNPGMRERVRNAIINAWSQGKRLDEAMGQDAAMALYRQMGTVPVERMTANTTWTGAPIAGAGKSTRAAMNVGDMMDNLWEFMYGTPQQRRSGVFFDRFYREARDIYESRFAGRVVDVDWLRRRVPELDEIEAEALIASPSAELRRAAKESGLVWPREIEMRATRWAEKKALDLMYTFTSASILGRKAQRYYNPFGRAQVDYVRWWLKKTFEPLTVGLSPQAQRAVAAAADALNPGRLPVRAGERVGVRTVTDTVESAAQYSPESAWVPQIPMPNGNSVPVPLNVSLWAKFSHVFAAMDRERERVAAEAEAAGADPEAAEAAAKRKPSLLSSGSVPTVGGLVDTFTFFPTDLTANNLLMNVVPQPGYMPILAMMMVSQMMTDDPNNATRNMLEDVFPGLRYYDGDTLDSWQDLVSLPAPTGAKSIRGMLGSFTRLINQKSGQNGQGMFGDIWDFVAGNKGLAPPNVQVRAADYAGDWLSTGNNAFTELQGDPEWAEVADSLYAQAYAEQNVKYALSRLPAPFVPGWNSRIPQDIGYIRHYKPVLDSLDSLAQWGVVPSDRVDDIRKLYTRWENSGQPDNVDLTARELDTLATWLNTIIYTEQTTITLDAEGKAKVNPAYLASLTEDQRKAFDTNGTLPMGVPQAAIDFWLLEHPGLAVNMVSKVRGRMTAGKLDVPDRYRPYFYSDGSVDNTALWGLGPQEAGDLRSEMLHLGYLVDRQTWDNSGDGWLQEAQRLVQQAGRRDIQRQWQNITLTPWGSGQPSAATLVGTFVVPPEIAERLGRYGDFAADGPVSGQWLHDALVALRGGMLSTSPSDVAAGIADRKMQQNATVPSGSPVRSGADLYRMKQEVLKIVEDRDGITSEWDLPNAERNLIREYVYQAAINSDIITANDYRLQGLDRIYGNLDMAPPALTSVSQMTDTLVLRDTEIGDRVEVVDGDTVNINMDDGTELSIRIQGVNAPDRGQYKWQEASDGLQYILDNAQEIAFGVYMPETYGSVQIADPTTGRRRAKLFLIADGVPIIDPAVYTVSSPQGVNSGVWGYLPPIRQIYMDGIGRVAS